MKQQVHKNDTGSRLRWLGLLMAAAIFVVTGFQFYWLQENYQREKKTLAIKTESQFRETMTKLQISKLKLQGFEEKDLKGKSEVRVIVSNNMDTNGGIPRVPGKEEMYSTIDVIREKMKDSLKKDPRGNVVISMQKNMGSHTDSIHFMRSLPGQPNGKDYIFNLLYGVDSLQDSIKVEEIRTAYGKQLVKQGIDVPFTVVRIDSAVKRSDNNNNCITVGFANPITYQFALGNTFSYLLRQLTKPILFSILLLGITILSFVLLYRNLVKQQRLAALKNEFISNITHELKTPIATVGVAIEALKNFNAISDPARTKEYLDISSNELQRLSLLVDKVLKLSMFEKKEMDLKYELLDLEELVKEVAASLKLQLEKCGAKLSITRDGDVSLMGDRLHLLSVVFNLLDNAIKYRKGEPVISINVKEEGNDVILTVSDNGIGIPAAYKDKIFEKFFRIPHGDTHNAKGYGLGLSYVAQVVRNHGGQVGVSSDGDTVFTIRLPKVKA